MANRWDLGMGIKGYRGQYLKALFESGGSVVMVLQ